MAIKEMTESATSNVDTMSRVYSVFLAVYPILCMYAGFYRFTIGDLVLFAFYLLCLNKMRLRGMGLLFGVLFATYAFVLLSINIMVVGRLSGGSSSILFFRLLKFIFYFTAVYVCSKTLFRTNTFCLAMLAVAVFAAGFLLVQYIMYYTSGTILLGRIPGFSIYVEDYANIDYEYVYSFKYRPCSIFLEPAHYCQYSIVALLILLFYPDSIKQSYKWPLIIVIAISMLATTSAQGFLYLVIVFSVFAYQKLKQNILMIAIVFFMLVIAIIGYHAFDPMHYAIDRLLFGSDASSARMGSSKYIFDMGGFQMVFGNGYGSTLNGEYFAGFAYVWYGTGIIGLALVFLTYFGCFRDSKSTVGKMACAMFLIMLFGTSLFYNYMLFWYFSIVVCFQSDLLLGETSIQSYSLSARCSPHRIEAR